MIDNRQAFGVVGGLGALAGADFLQHLIHATAGDPERYAVVFEQQSFPGDRLRADAGYDPTGRKLHAFTLIRRLEMRGASAILLVFIGSKIFVADFFGWTKFPAEWSLTITFAILSAGVLYSVWRTRPVLAVKGDV